MSSYNVDEILQAEEQGNGILDNLFPDEQPQAQSQVQQGQKQDVGILGTIGDMAKGVG